MKNSTMCIFLLTMLTACAGNPPAWWNPSGRYSTPSQSSSSIVAAPVKTPTNTVSSPVPETFVPTDTEYEEMVLSPIAIDENVPASADLAPSILGE